MSDPSPSPVEGTSRKSAEKPQRRRWTIDVCRTCGRLAQWPFCEHRANYNVGTPGFGWCEPVTVQEVGHRG